MNRGARLELKKRIARTLAEQSWPEIDATLEEFRLPTQETWNNDQQSYCFEMLRSASDATLVELNTYLHNPVQVTVVDDEPWKTDDLRLFIGHVHTHRRYASELKMWLSWYGIEGFVAHVDIEPTKEWQDVIEASLCSCHAMVALLHQGFHESKWCDQEVGFVLGRRLVVVPVRIDLQPYGFLGSVQSLPAIGVSTQDLAYSIAKVLLRDPRTGGLLTDPMVRALCASDSFKQSNLTADLLAAHAPLITSEHVRLIQEARKTNSQVQYAHQVGPALDVFKQKFGVDGTPLLPEPPSFDPSLEPF
jgi:hypothetical protein